MINISDLEPDQAGNRYITFAYCEGDEQLGYLKIEEPERKSIEIAGLFVDQKYRSKGIAPRLIGELIKWCSENYPSVEKLTAYIAPMSPAGDAGVTPDALKTFYEKQGFILKPHGTFGDEFMGTLFLK
jgi:Acetyltransferase (GNAT) family.